MKLLIILSSIMLTGCISSGLSKTCQKFDMDTQYVEVIAVDHEVLDKAYTQTRFKCVPKTRYKNGK